MVEHPKEFIRVWVVLLDLFCNDGGVWVVGWYIGEIGLCTLSYRNYFGEG